MRVTCHNVADSMRAMRDPRDWVIKQVQAGRMPDPAEQFEGVYNAQLELDQGDDPALEKVTANANATASCPLAATHAAIELALYWQAVQAYQAQAAAARNRVRKLKPYRMKKEQRHETDIIG